MFQWLMGLRRDRLMSGPFPPEWEDLLQSNVVHYRMLTEAERARLRALILVFVAEKHWEGCGGLDLTDEIRVTIAAQACLLILELPHDFYGNVESILVYPSTVVPRRPTLEPPRAFVPVEEPQPILGAVFPQGPVLLVWDAVQRDARHPKHGHNVVYHEFAHKLDLIDGLADGTPPLRGDAEFTEWVQVCTREYQRLRQDLDQGHSSFLNAYGAVKEAEFFAVATEQFFDRPEALEAQAPDLYRVLKACYRQDPIQRARRIRGGAACH